MTAIAIAERMPYDFERDILGRVWWGVPDRHDPETGEVSFAPHTASKKGKLEAGVASKTQFLTVG